MFNPTSIKDHKVDPSSLRRIASLDYKEVELKIFSSLTDISKSRFKETLTIQGIKHG